MFCTNGKVGSISHYFGSEIKRSNSVVKHKRYLDQMCPPNWQLKGRKLSLNQLLNVPRVSMIMAEHGWLHFTCVLRDHRVNLSIISQLSCSRPAYVNPKKKKKPKEGSLFKVVKGWQKKQGFWQNVNVNCTQHNHYLIPEHVTQNI